MRGDGETTRTTSTTLGPTPSGPNGSADKLLRDQELQHLVTSSIPSPPYAGLSLLNINQGFTILDPNYSAILFASIVGSAAAANGGGGGVHNNGQDTRFPVPMPMHPHQLQLPLAALPNMGLGMGMGLGTVMSASPPTSNGGGIHHLNNNNNNHNHHHHNNKDLHHHNGRMFSYPIIDDRCFELNKYNQQLLHQNPQALLQNQNHHHHNGDRSSGEKKHSNGVTSTTISPQESSQGSPLNNNNLFNGNNKTNGVKKPRAKLYTCTTCNRSFGRKHVLESHEKTHHRHHEMSPVPLSNPSTVTEVDPYLILPPSPGGVPLTPNPSTSTPITNVSSTTTVRGGGRGRGGRTGRNAVVRSSTPTSSVTSQPQQQQAQNGSNRDKVFTCPICNRCFGYKHVLQNHERTHTGEKPYFCKICSKRFTRDHHLKTHMRLHTGEKPYNCDHCDKQFVQVANLRRHMRVHTGERPYTCGVCDARFSDSNQLKAHTLIHKGQKPYYCEVCKLRFRRRHHLTNHKCVKMNGASDNQELQHFLPLSPPDTDNSPPTPSSTGGIMGMPMGGQGSGDGGGGAVGSNKRERKSRETRRIIRVAGLPVATVAASSSGLDSSFLSVLPEQTHPEDLSISSSSGSGGLLGVRDMSRDRHFSGSGGSRSSVVSASPSPISGGSLS